ncbi:MAG: hypothetical protein EOP04_17950 [Proteobacteria bacterium]|nr:MAG: hypothetical protein EOP04_17950 [Pseudomonadota bacterium]
MSGKLKKPKFTGMKIYCNACKRDNPTCKHYDDHHYRVRLHVKGSKSDVRSKKLNSRNYDEAVDEAIAFKKEMIYTNYQAANKSRVKGDSKIPVRHTLVSMILKYDTYLAGRHELVHLRKEVSDAHRKEAIRCCSYFSDSIKKTENLLRMPVEQVSQHHVAAFYSWAEKEYAPRTFNKMMAAIKAFFDFIISVEKVKMENPFGVYVTKQVQKGQIQTLTKDEFQSILEAVDNADPIAFHSNGQKRNMFEPYLKDAFKLFALTGGRREEVVELKWSDLMMSMQGVWFFQVENLKVTKQKRTKNHNTATKPKFFPVNSDLLQLLKELGQDEFNGQDRYIFYPERSIVTKTIMDKISKAFTHYRKAAGITKKVSLDELRKTYLTWLNAVLNKDTRILSSHASDAVLKNHYLDPTIISVLEKTALELKIFGA